MGLSDPAHGVLPKVALLAEPREGGSIASRFYVPWNCHVAHSTSGALCIAAATRIEGTVAHDFASTSTGKRERIEIEHPSGRLAVHMSWRPDTGDSARHTRASVVLTARPRFDGLAFVRPLHS